MVIQNVLENESKINEALASIRMGSIEMVEDEKSHTVIPTIHEIHNPKPEFIKTILESGETNSCDWIEPGSTTDEPEIKDSPKHSEFFHNLSEKIHSIGEHMHLLEPKEGTINHHGNHPGLLETAIATMLIEKLNIAEASAGMKPIEIPEGAFTPELEEKSVIHEIKETVSDKISRIGSHIHMPHLDPHQLSQKLQKIATELHIPEMGRSKSHVHIRGFDIPSPTHGKMNRTQSITLAQLARKHPDIPNTPSPPKAEQASFYTIDELDGDPVVEVQLKRTDVNQEMGMDTKGFFLGENSPNRSREELDLYQVEVTPAKKTLSKSVTSHNLASSKIDTEQPTSTPLSATKESILHGLKEKIYHISEHVHLPHITTHDLKETIQVIQEKIHLPHFHEKSTPAQRRFSLDTIRNRLNTARKSLSLDRPIFARKRSEPSIERLSIDSEDTLKEKSTSKSTGSVQTVQEVGVPQLQDDATNVVAEKKDGSQERYDSEIESPFASALEKSKDRNNESFGNDQSVLANSSFCLDFSGSSRSALASSMKTFGTVTPLPSQSNFSSNFSVTPSSSLSLSTSFNSRFSLYTTNTPNLNANTSFDTSKSCSNLKLCSEIKPLNTPSITNPIQTDTQNISKQNYKRYQMKTSQINNNNNAKNNNNKKKNYKHDPFRSDTKIANHKPSLHASSLTNRNEALPSSPSSRPFHARTESVSGNRPAPVVGTPSSAVINITKEAAGMALNRRSSDSDLSITPKGK